MVAIVYAILYQQMESSWVTQSAGYIATLNYPGWPDKLSTKHSNGVTWVTRVDDEGPPDVRVSTRPIFTLEECKEIVSYAFKHADAWMNSYHAVTPTLYAVFGGDINYGAAAHSHELNFGKPFWPWHTFAPWLSDYLPNWNFVYGFEQYIGCKSYTIRLMSNMSRSYTLAG